MNDKSGYRTFINLLNDKINEYKFIKISSILLLGFSMSPLFILYNKRKTLKNDIYSNSIISFNIIILNMN